MLVSTPRNRQRAVGAYVGCTYGSNGLPLSPRVEGVLSFVEWGVVKMRCIPMSLISGTLPCTNWKCIDMPHR